MNDLASNTMNSALAPAGDVSTAARPLSLALHFALHTAALVVAWSLLAAANKWAMSSELGIAKLLSIIAGVLAGSLFVTAMHEWFHLLGAKLVKAEIAMATKPGIMLYHWHFPYNSVAQFMIMSVSGAAGGLLGLLILFTQLSPNTVGYTAALAAAIGITTFTAVLEWPVIWRTRNSREAGKEYDKVTSSVALTSAAAGFAVGTLSFLALG